MISFLSKIYPLILLAICILAVPLSSRIKKMEEEKQNVFRMMRFPMFVGVATGVIFAIVLLALAFSDVEAGTYIAVALFSLTSLLLISSFFTFHIEYDKEGFTHRNALGIKRRYRYTDVTGISGGAEQGDITLYADGHKIRIDEGANPIKKRDFLKCVRTQYRKNNKGQTLPRKRPKIDIFNGNVNHPGGFIFIYILVSVFFLGMTIPVFIMSMPTKAEDLTYKTITFDRYIIEKEEDSADDLCLYAGDMEYRINSYEDYLKNKDHFFAHCDGKNAFEVGVTSGETCYHIKTLATANGIPYFTLEEINRAEQKNMIPFYLIMGVFLLLWFMFIFFSIRIGRNPGKYPKWLVHGFFKPGYINR